MSLGPIVRVTPPDLLDVFAPLDPGPVMPLGPLAPAADRPGTISPRAALALPLSDPATQSATLNAATTARTRDAATQPMLVAAGRFAPAQAARRQSAARSVAGTWRTSVPVSRSMRRGKPVWSWRSELAAATGAASSRRRGKASPATAISARRFPSLTGSPAATSCSVTREASACAAGPDPAGTSSVKRAPCVSARCRNPAVEADGSLEGVRTRTCRPG